MANTANFNIPKPDPEANVDEEFLRLQVAWDIVDAVLKAITDAVAAKAAASHLHTIANVTGLADALAGKMPSSTTFALDDLTDVDGATAAAVGYLLVKQAGRWVPSSPAAALGSHQHSTADIVGLASLVASSIAAYVGAAPAALDSFVELAAALGDDPNFAASMATALAAKADKHDLAATGTVSLPATTSIGNVSAAELSFLDGVTSAIQAQLNSKAAAAHAHTAEDIAGFNAAAVAAMATMTAGGVGSLAWAYRSPANSSITAGSTYAGSNLVFSGTLGTSSTLGYTSGTGLSGTWRALGTAGNESGKYSSTLFVRIA